MRLAGSRRLAAAAAAVGAAVAKPAAKRGGGGGAREGWAAGACVGIDLGTTNSAVAPHG